jgi:hypothetical protein
MGIIPDGSRYLHVQERMAKLPDPAYRAVLLAKAFANCIVGKNCGLILIHMIPIEEPGRLEGGNVGETKPPREANESLSVPRRQYWLPEVDPCRACTRSLFQHSRVQTRLEII